MRVNDTTYRIGPDVSAVQVHDQELAVRVVGDCCFRERELPCRFLHLHDRAGEAHVVVDLALRRQHLREGVASKAVRERLLRAGVGRVGCDDDKRSPADRARRGRGGQGMADVQIGALAHV